ncbi:MAG: ThuA domain-containing protein [Eubacteriales bacterium]|nr:ThuA domain-containing protein [Eubacteriales bacterium]
MIRVTVWNEFRHELTDQKVKDVYPNGIHEAIADFLGKEEDIEITATAYLDKDEEHGLSQQVLDNTDVLLWWGHIAHGEVKDEIVDRVYNQILLKGMGLIVLHSGHASKIFSKVCGTITGLLHWREDDKLERLWVADPSHPIAAGITNYFEVPKTEMYGEFFNIPRPDELVFISWFEGGEVFRSGCVWRRGMGKVFYFRPGHETNPVYYQPEIQLVLKNAVRYLAPPTNQAVLRYYHQTTVDQFDRFAATKLYN